jgi:hypothetical protein
MNRTNPSVVLCPSAPMEEGAILVGIVLADGKVAFAPDRIEVNADFVASAREGRSPEKRFRFGGVCVKSGCRQWTGTRCGVIDHVLEVVPTESRTDYLPECSIRDQCRWFAQSGSEACRVCTLVVTDTRRDSVAEAVEK